MAKRLVAPKRCKVAWVQLDSRGAVVGYRCGDPREGSELIFPSPGGGRSNYPSKRLRGVRSVRVNGASVTGFGSRVGFELSPRSATCHRDGSEIRCRVK